MAKKKPTKDLVPVGTHVPLITKLTLQAMAESQDTTVYALIQSWIEEKVSEYGEAIDSLKVKTEEPSEAVLEDPAPEQLEVSEDDDLLS